MDVVVVRYPWTVDIAVDQLVDVRILRRLMWSVDVVVVGWSVDVVVVRRCPTDAATRLPDPPACAAQPPSIYHY